MIHTKTVLIIAALTVPIALPMPAQGDLYLYIDSDREELFLHGSDSGAASDAWSPGPNAVVWEQEGFALGNVQGIALPVAGGILNLNVSISRKKIAVFVLDVFGDLTFAASDQRVDYSWMLPEVKDILAGLDEVELELREGSGFAPLQVQGYIEFNWLAVLAALAVAIWWIRRFAPSLLRQPA